MPSHSNPSRRVGSAYGGISYWSVELSPRAPRAEGRRIGLRDGLSSDVERSR